MEKKDIYSMNEVEILLQEIQGKPVGIQNGSDEGGQHLQELLQRCCDISSGQTAFLNEHCSEESKIQARILNETRNDLKVSHKAKMLSGPVVGQLLKMVAEMLQARRILDIGTFTGYSAVSLAETMFCEEVISLDIDEYAKQFVESKLAGTPLAEKVQVKIGPALESLAALRKENKCFDMVFIDADKTSYLDYYKYIMDNNMLRSNGAILCDNIYFYNKTILEKESEIGRSLNAFASFVKNDPRVDQIILPMRDGLMLIKSKAIISEF